jgi:hypothetical protein
MIDQKAILARVEEIKKSLWTIRESAKVRLPGNVEGSIQSTITRGSCSVRRSSPARAGIIVAHNHPSGDPTPSADDWAVARQRVDEAVGQVAGRGGGVSCRANVVLYTSATGAAR